MRLRNEVNEQTQTKPPILGTWEPDILKIECEQENIIAHLSDGRVVSLPKAWYKPFREATIQQLAHYEILPQKKGVYFPAVDEYLSIKSFTHGLNSACC